MKSKELKIQRHPLSALFSRFDLAGEDLEALAEDIRTNGQRQTITSYDGMILDGWNRYQACKLAKVKPRIEGLEPGYDPWEFVKGANMLRRHMTPAERVAVMCLYFQLTGEEQGEEEEPVKIDRGPQAGAEPPSVRQIQKDLEVSHGTAVKAQQIAKAHDPALSQALADKRVSLDEAANLAKLPPEERQVALKEPAPKAPKPSKNARRLAAKLGEQMKAEGYSDEEIQEHLDSAQRAASLKTDHGTEISVVHGAGDPAVEALAQGYIDQQAGSEPKPKASMGEQAHAAQVEGLLEERDLRIAELERRLEEAASQIQELHEENEAYRRILDAEGDDLLARFDKECKRNQERSRVAEARARSLAGQVRDLQTYCKRYKKAAEKAEKNSKKVEEPVGVAS